MKAGNYRAQFDLTGAVALVTGGVGLLGKRFCAALADHGASVAVVDVNEAACRTFAEELSDGYGVRCGGFGADISDPAVIASLADAVEQSLGPITVLHSNAATKGKDLDRFFDPVETFSPGVWREIMAVNLDGMFFVTREIGARMAARGEGSIIQTASIYGALAPDQRIYEGSEYMGRSINTPAVYSASKAGVLGLTRYFASYWGQSGVRVNALTPGGVSSGQNTVFSEKYSARVPLGRMAEADEITGALIFLASRASAYVTGQNLMVDGGLSAW